MGGKKGDAGRERGRSKKQGGDTVARFGEKRGGTKRGRENANKKKDSEKEQRW